MKFAFLIVCIFITVTSTHQHDKVLVAGGGTTVVEVIDLSSATTKCQDLVPLPETSTGFDGLQTVGGLGPRNEPTVCTGAYDDTHCYSLENGVWNEFAALQRHAIAISKAPFANDSLIWSGGISDQSGNASDAIEVLAENGWQTISPSLPEKLIYHCMVWYNSSTIVVIGGIPNDLHSGDNKPSTKTYILNTDSGEWIDGPTLKHGRYAHSCSRVKVSNDTDAYGIIVVGGRTNTDIPNTSYGKVEILKPGLDSNWQDGPEPPQEISDGVLVETRDGGVVIIGGINPDRDPWTVPYVDMFRIDNLNPESEWKEMSQKLKNGRISFSAFLVPDDITDCSN